MIETPKGFLKPEQNDVTDKLRVSIGVNADKADGLITALEQAGGSAVAGIAALAGRVGAVETGKADKATTLSGYGITDGATKTELNLKAPIASPALTGTPTAPTASVGTNNTQLATTAFVQAAKNTVDGLITLTHSKSGTVHALTGLSGKTGLLSVKFKATAAFVAGDSFRVDGVMYTAKLTNGKALAANQFVSGAVVDCLLDVGGKTVNFKGGGVDVSAATATEADVLVGKTFFAGLDGVRTGIMKPYYRIDTTQIVPAPPPGGGEDIYYFPYELNPILTYVINIAQPNSIWYVSTNEYQSVGVNTNLTVAIESAQKRVKLKVSRNLHLDKEMTLVITTYVK